ncbi:nuclease-related domain-containing protein [Desulfobacter sp.]
MFNHVTLTTDGTTPIDPIIISKYEIFVVETKNMKGWIFGQPKQKMWTQKIFKHSSKFKNPLHLNKH